MEDFGDLLGAQKQASIQSDLILNSFYDRLSGVSLSWFPLEDGNGDHTYYRNTEVGTLALGRLTDFFEEWPNLEYFNFTQARHGGPIGKSYKVI